MKLRRSAGFGTEDLHPAPPIDPSPIPVGIEAIYVERVIAVTLLALLTLGCVFVLRPFLPALLWAVILAVSTWPAYTYLERKLGGRTLPALIMTLGTALLLLLPVVLLSVHLSESAANLFGTVRTGLDSGFPPLPRWIAEIPVLGPRVQDFWTRTASDKAALAAALQPYAGPVRLWLLERGGDVLSAIVEVTISLFVAFFLYRDGRATANMLAHIMTRLTGHRSGRLLRTASDTIIGVVHGVLGTSLLQAILMAVAFWFTDVPAALLLGFIAFFVSLIPMGLALLWIPVSIWLAVQDHTGAAIFMAVWGLFVGTIDNWLRPMLILNRSELPLALILLGVLGGALVFGFLGIFLGPVLLAVAYSLIHEWGSAQAQHHEAPPA